MPVARYFMYVGGVLLALLFAIDAFMPQDVAHAFSEMVTNLMRDPSKLAKAQTDLWHSHAALWQDILTKRFGPEEDQPAASRDRRFKDEEWDKNLAFNTLKRNYLIGAEWLRKLVADQNDLPRPTQKKLEFFTERFIDAVSPTNFVATNPAVLRKTVEILLAVILSKFVIAVALAIGVAALGGAGSTGAGASAPAAEARSCHSR